MPFYELFFEAKTFAMRRLIAISFCLVVLFHVARSQNLSAEEILNKSIAFHDPDGEWPTLKTELTFKETRPNGPDRKTVAMIDNSQSFFQLNRNDEEIYKVEMENCVVEKGQGTSERGLMLRNYYTYLWGLPMKLKDPGTNLDEAYAEESIDGVRCYVLRVPYEKDIWYFYIRKDNYAMIAYKFYKDESTEKGEYIPTEGLFTVGNMKIPNNRTWYELPGNRVLGTDILTAAK